MRSDTKHGSNQMYLFYKTTGDAEGSKNTKDSLPKANRKYQQCNQALCTSKHITSVCARCFENL